MSSESIATPFLRRKGSPSFPPSLAFVFVTQLVIIKVDTPECSRLDKRGNNSVVIDILQNDSPGFSVSNEVTASALKQYSKFVVDSRMDTPTEHALLSPPLFVHTNSSSRLSEAEMN